MSNTTNPAVGPNIGTSLVHRQSAALLEPLFSEPEEALDQSVVEELAARSTMLKSDLRKVRQYDRHRILRSQHEGLIANRIAGLFRNKDNREGHQQHIEISVNPAADVVESVCQLYRHGANRRLEDAEGEELEAWQRLTLSSGIAARASDWTPQAYFVGPTAIIPTYRRGKLRLYSPRPHVTDFVFDSDDPLADPVAVSWPVGGRANLAILDATALRYYRVDPRTKKATEIEEMVEVHDLGYAPFATLRFDTPCDHDDWCNYDMHRRLRDGAIAVGRIMAAMGFVRRSQNKWLLKLVGQTDSVAKQQNIAHPERVVIARTAANTTAGDMDFDAVDFNTSPENFIQEIQLHASAMARSTGVAITVDGDSNMVELQYDHAQLTELRNAQIWYAHQFEADLWRAVVDLGRLERNKEALAIGRESNVEERLTLEFPVLHRDFADPMKEAEWWDWKIKRGLASPVEAGRRFFGPMTDEQIRERIKNNAEDSRDLWDRMAAGDTPDSFDAASIGDGLVSAAQRNGAMGRAVRDGKVPPPGGREDDPNDNT